MRDFLLPWSSRVRTSDDASVGNTGRETDRQTLRSCRSRAKQPETVFVTCRCLITLLSTVELVFTALHIMQTRYSEENSVRLSVRLFVTRVYCDKTKERCVQIFIPYERTFILVF